MAASSKLAKLKRRIQGEIFAAGYRYALGKWEPTARPEVLSLEKTRGELEDEIRARWNADPEILAFDEDELQEAVSVALALAVATWDAIRARPHAGGSGLGAH
jgi:hypothetical protein